MRRAQRIAKWLKVNHFGARPPVAVSGDSDTSCGEFLMSTRSYPTSVLVGALSSRGTASKYRLRSRAKGVQGQLRSDCHHLGGRHAERLQILNFLDRAAVRSPVFHAGARVNSQAANVRFTDKALIRSLDPVCRSAHGLRVSSHSTGSNCRHTAVA